MIDRVHEEFRVLGLAPDESRTLLILLGVYVAACASLPANSAARRLTVIARRLGADKAAERAWQWCHQVPHAGYFRRGFLLLRSLLAMSDEHDVTHHDLQQVLAYLQALAGPNPEAQRANKQLQAYFGVVVGVPWDEVLAGLGETAAAPMRTSSVLSRAA